jgi:hypothetical protein
MRFSWTHEVNENAFEYLSFASEITRKVCIVVKDKEYLPLYFM